MTSEVKNWVRGFWKTVAEVRPASEMSVAGTSTPATSTVPCSSPEWKWGTSPLRRRRAVDLPDPEAPHRRVRVPRGTSRSMSSRQGAPGVSPESYRKETSWTRMTGLPPGVGPPGAGRPDTGPPGDAAGRGALIP